MNILSEVQSIFRDVFDDHNLVITQETNAKDIEDWDSLSQIFLVEAIEKKFTIKFNMEDVAEFKNVGDILRLIEKYSKS